MVCDSLSLIPMEAPPNLEQLEMRLGCALSLTIHHYFDLHATGMPGP